MRIKYVGNLADRALNVVKSGEASASIPRGTPVILNIASTSAADDGLSVVLPATAGSAASYVLRYGVVTSTLAAGQLGESILFGVANYALITRMTRAASSDSWTSSASVANMINLGIDTLNNAFLLGASIAGSIASNGGNAFLLDSLASVAASASNTSDARTAITLGVRVYTRML